MSTQNRMLRWIDGHLDLAYLAVCGRDLTQPGSGASTGCIDLPALRDAGVALAFATIFTEPGEDAAARGFGYRGSGDLEGAHAAGLRQLEVYRRLERDGCISMVRRMRDLALTDGAFLEQNSTIRVKPPLNSRTADCLTNNTSPGPSRPLQVVLLMEGADPVRTPDDLGTWFDAGVRIVGLTWAMGTRYAGGNARPGPLTAPGRELVAAIDSLGMVHDISHLADAAVDELLQTARGPVIASHSNCRSLLDGVNQRHLRDEHIRAIGARGGIIGLNLYSPFLAGSSPRATIDDCLRHLEHVCEIMGHRRGIALGSDMDGGFAPDRLPIGLDHPSKLSSLVEALRGRGWSDDDVECFACGNWGRFLERVVCRLHAG